MRPRIALSDTLVLIAAMLSLVYSFTLWSTGHLNEALYVGLWVPSIIGLSILIRTAIKKQL